MAALKSFNVQFYIREQKDLDLVSISHFKLINIFNSSPVFISSIHLINPISSPNSSTNPSSPW